MRADKRINTLMRLKHFITEVSRHACIVKLIHAGKHTCLHLQAPRYRIWQVQYPEVHRVETWGSSHEAYLRSSRAAEPKSILCLKLSYLQKPFFLSPYSVYHPGSSPGPCGKRISRQSSGVFFSSFGSLVLANLITFTPTPDRQDKLNFISSQLRNP